MGHFSRLATGLALVQAVVASVNVHLENRQSSANCSVLELILVRGTDEPGGSNGYGIDVGDPVFNATRALIPGITGYGVVYPANLACDSVPIGISVLLNRVNTTTQNCPGQKFALVGYSQGADVVYRAAAQLASAQWPSVIAIAGFGDPNHRGAGNVDPLGGTVLGPLPQVLEDRLIELCAYNDPICSNNGTLLTQHTSYHNANETYINNTAAYIQKQLQSNGAAGSDFSQATPAGNETDGNVQALLYLGKLLGNTGTTTLQSMCSSTSYTASTATSSVVASTNSTMTATTSHQSAVTGTAATGSSSTTSTAQSSTGGASTIFNFSTRRLQAMTVLVAMYTFL